MKLRTAIIAAGCAAVFAASAAGPVKKKPSAPAKVVPPAEFFRQGYEAYRDFDCAKALQLFHRGLKQKSDPRAWYFVGNCERWRGEQAASDAAYSSGLKASAPGSKEQADLESARASLAIAFDPARKLQMFYKAIQDMGFTPPPGELQVGDDPRFYPIHPEQEWLVTKETSSPQTQGCTRWGNSDVSSYEISVTKDPIICLSNKNGIEIYEISGVGLTYTITDELAGKDNKAYPRQRGKSGGQVVRKWKLKTSVSSAYPEKGWPERYVIKTITHYDPDSVRLQSDIYRSIREELRCIKKNSKSDTWRSLSDGPQVEYECAQQTNTGGNPGEYYSGEYFQDVTTGLGFFTKVNAPDGSVRTTAVVGHVGSVGDAWVETTTHGNLQRTVRTKRVK